MNREAAQPLKLYIHDDWKDYAECNRSDVNNDMFFESDNTIEGRRAIAEAKRTCGQCAVQAYCLEYALETQQPFGIWGGYTDEERKVYRRRWAAQRRRERKGA